MFCASRCLGRVTEEEVIQIVKCTEMDIGSWEEGKLGGEKEKHIQYEESVRGRQAYIRQLL